MTYAYHILSRNEHHRASSLDIDINDEFKALLYAELMGESLQKSLDNATLAKLQCFASDHAQNIFVLRNVPLSFGLLETPSTEDIAFSHISRNVLFTLGLFSIIGKQGFAYEQENNARLVRHVTPKHGSLLKGTSHGSYHLGWHSEHPVFSIPGTEEVSRNDSPYAPEIIALTGVYNYEDIPTLIIETKALLDKAQAEHGSWLINALQKNHYDVPPGASLSNVEVRRSCPLLSISNEGHFKLRYSDAIVGTSDQARKALSALRQTLREEEDKLKIVVNLQHCDLLLFKNNTTLHKRSDFDANFATGMSRWLMRIFASNPKLI
ncbi:MAG: TauD/TfdA family dioxygenase [Gammaproteobacteria bacterium]|nr:TauD/TfdA family dioxygenase [Gammaproteobacteria bacterium]